MKIIATMIVRDEDDVVGETIEQMSNYTKDIVVLDGGSVDNTIEIVRSFSYVKLVEVNSGIAWNHSGERQMLLDLSKEADWVITFDADEIYHTSPLIAIEAAEKEGATVVRCEIPQFCFTEIELLNGTLQSEDERITVQERRKYYSWGWSDQMIFKMQEGLTYLGGKEGRITRPPHFNSPAIKTECSVRPILKHYQNRSLRQYAKKMKTRRRNCGANYLRWFSGTYANPFVNEETVNYFDGVFRDKRGNIV